MSHQRVRLHVDGVGLREPWSGIGVYTRALAATEIAALAPPPPPSTDGRVLAYDMETLNPSGQMIDLSGQGHHGTIVGVHHDRRLRDRRELA